MIIPISLHFSNHSRELSPVWKEDSERILYYVNEKLREGEQLTGWKKSWKRTLYLSEEFERQGLDNDIIKEVTIFTLCIYFVCLQKAEIRKMVRSYKMADLADFSLIWGRTSNRVGWKRNWVFCALMEEITGNFQDGWAMRQWWSWNSVRAESDDF